MTFGAERGKVEHRPEDMTATVDAGVTMAALQAELARHGQWLAVDPPNPGAVTMREVIDRNLSGPRRFGYGTIRDHLIGITVQLADGRIVHSGGKVVKNVAGYDLAKLFISGGGSLGTVREATFRLRPLPEAEEFRGARFGSLEEMERMMEAVMNSELTPCVVDVFPQSLVLGFAGTREEVAWQVGRAGELGVREAASLEHEAAFHASGSSARRISVLPSKLSEAIRELRGAPYVARAGNGVIYHRGPETKPREELPMELMRRVKAIFDPEGKLPPIAI